MHTYKDSINGFSSIVLFPGTTNVFYTDPNGLSEFMGVGAYTLKPGLETNLIKNYIKGVIDSETGFQY
jgi:predicted component of viral defense system (DUF524 family)